MRGLGVTSASVPHPVICRFQPFNFLEWMKEWKPKWSDDEQFYFQADSIKVIKLIRCAVALSLSELQFKPVVWVKVTWPLLHPQSLWFASSQTSWDNNDCYYPALPLLTSYYHASCATAANSWCSGYCQSRESAETAHKQPENKQNTRQLLSQPVTKFYCLERNSEKFMQLWFNKPINKSTC